MFEAHRRPSCSSWSACGAWRRSTGESDGHLSAASWLASVHRASWGTARAATKVARALEAMPLTRRAMESGEVSLAAARVLAHARDADPEAFSGSEATLLEAARIHSVGGLRRIAASWREACERDRGLDGEERLRARRRLHASVSFLGMVRVDGDLDPETGETLLTALRAVLDAESRSGGTDHRTPAQRRADALGEVCRGWLDLADRPTVAGERPHVTLTGGRRGDRGRLRARRARPRGSGPRHDCATPGVRRLGAAGGDGRALRAPRRRAAHEGGAARDAPGGDRAGSGVPVPGV
jgi:hypothetical protein